MMKEQSKSSLYPGNGTDCSGTKDGSAGACKA